MRHVRGSSNDRSVTVAGVEDKNNCHLFAVLRMLTPRHAGPVGPEEIGDGHDDKGASNTASGSVTPGGSYESGDNSKEFLSTGRTGRRNALPNILGRHAKTGLSDLPDRFGALSTHPGVDLSVIRNHLAVHRSLVRSRG